MGKEVRTRHWFGFREWLTLATLLGAGVVVPSSAQAIFDSWLLRQQQEQCGDFAERKPSDSELSDILKRHEEWFLEVWNPLPPHQKEHGGARKKALADPRRANLCMADLSGVDLSNKNLAAANLMGANLSSSNLTDANLSWANLSGGFRGRHAFGVFPKGYFPEGNFPRSSVPRTDLSGSILIRTNLSNANFYNAILTSATFEPLTPGLSPDTRLPVLDFLATSTGLSRLRYEESPRALTELKEGLIDVGFTSQSRELAAAIKRSADLNSIQSGPGVPALSAAVSFVLLGVTCDYGAHPGIALMWLCTLLISGASAYMMSLWEPRENLGIVATWKDPEDSSSRERVSSDFFLKRAQNISNRLGWAAFIGFLVSLLLAVSLASGEGLSPYPLLELIISVTGWNRVAAGFLVAMPFWAAISIVGLFSPRFLRALAGGLWFSLIVTFRIGWRDLSLGTWLSHLQPRPYVLEPIGWLRTFAGIQSIVGVYLMGLLLLTYFRPLFEVG